MIHQISPVKTKTGAIPAINRSLIQARHIQDVVKERIAGRIPARHRRRSGARSPPAPISSRSRAGSNNPLNSHQPNILTKGKL